MNDYIRKALNEIYGKDDNFIIIGLTGQTGSGCTTAAKILASDREDISHSLYQGNTPETNEQRKEKIIYNYFNKNWDKFHIIKASAVITLLWASTFDNENSKFFLKTFIVKNRKIFKDNNLLLNKDKSIIERIINALESELKLLSLEYEKVQKKHKESSKTNKNSKIVIDFYTKIISQTNDKIKESLGNDIYVALYQALGTNIRLSGDVYSGKEVEGKFFTLSEKINEIIEKIRASSENKKTFIVIDALRNPLEAFFSKKDMPLFI